MNKLPKNGIKKILGVDVLIEYTDEIDDGASLGECLSDKNIIRIVKQKRAAMQETLIHEELEYLNHKMVLDLNHDQIERLTTGINSITNGNK
jgi:hypothetical protein